MARGDIDCPECETPGLCRACEGEGSYEVMTGDGNMVRELCEECNGSGKCWFCEGSGKVTEDDLAQISD